MLCVVHLFPSREHANLLHATLRAYRDGVVHVLRRAGEEPTKPALWRAVYTATYPDLRRRYKLTPHLAEAVIHDAHRLYERESIPVDTLGITYHQDTVSVDWIDRVRIETIEHPVTVPFIVVRYTRQTIRGIAELNHLDDVWVLQITAPRLNRLPLPTPSSPTMPAAEA